MKRFWSGVITATVVATVGLGAQGAPAGGSAQGGAAPQGAGAQAGGQKVTVTGCIESAPAATAGAAAEGAKASASAGQNFVLADAKMAGSKPGAGAVGTTGTSASRYELDGDSKTISSHLNQQVEITGTVQSSSASAAGQSSSAPGSRAASPRLKVESVKMVSATCS